MGNQRHALYSLKGPIQNELKKIPFLDSDTPDLKELVHSKLDVGKGWNQQEFRIKLL